MRILHVAETIKGGIATYLNTLDSNVAHEHHYLLPESQVAEVSIDRARIRTFRGDTRLSRTFNLLLALARTPDKAAFDLIHLHSSFAGYVFLLQRALAVKLPPAVFCAHGWSFLRQVSGLERSLCKAVDYLIGLAASGVIHISESERRAAEFIPCKHQKTIYNPIARRYLAPLSSGRTSGEPRTLLFVGRLDRQKGFDVLYEAFKSPELAGHRLLVAGDAVLGENRPAPTENVSFLGWQPADALPRLYERADLTVMPSRWEGFGFVAIESLARGTPVLASSVGALSEILGEHGNTTDLSTPENIVRALSDTTVHPHGSPQALQDYVKEHFSPSRFAEAIDSFYRLVATR